MTVSQRNSLHHIGLKAAERIIRMHVLRVEKTMACGSPVRFWLLLSQGTSVFPRRGALRVRWASIWNLVLLYLVDDFGPVIGFSRALFFLSLKWGYAKATLGLGRMMWGNQMYEALSTVLDTHRKHLVACHAESELWGQTFSSHLIKESFF